jgi:hypothetical protein
MFRSEGLTLLAAGQYWLAQIARPDSRLSSRTIADYTWTWATYVEARTSSLRRLTLDQANDPQRLRVFLQRVAEAHGSASANLSRQLPRTDRLSKWQDATRRSMLLPTIRPALHRAARPVHPDRATRDPAGQRPRPGRDRVHPPRQPSRRPGPAHPRCGRQQGPDPRRTLAVHRRPGAVQSQRCRLRDLVVLRFDSGTDLFIHAMSARPQYIDLIK